MEGLTPVLWITFFGLISHGFFFYLGTRFRSQDPYINSTNAELRRRNATRKARRKIKSWKDT